MTTYTADKGLSELVPSKIRASRSGQKHVKIKMESGPLGQRQLKYPTNTQ
jgi:hypothetical protein